MPKYRYGIWMTYFGETEATDQKQAEKYAQEVAEGIQERSTLELGITEVVVMEANSV